MDEVADLKSWEQAFEQYPVATTRKIEKKLVANIVRDKDKLRSLVGGSYRDLLSTAEQIVALDIKTKSAESQISNLSLNCKPPSFIPKIEPGEPDRRLVIAQFSLVQKCTVVISANLKNGQLLQGAELLVIARLLHKSLSESKSPIKLLEPLREKISSLRRQLIRRVDGRFTAPSCGSSQLTEAVCAYCLVTNSSSDDALRHFYHLRLEQIRQRTADGLEDASKIPLTFKYYVRTLLTTKSLLGRQVSDALGNLQKQPILRDVALRIIDTLSLDMLSPLIASDIQNFIPYIKRSTITREELESINGTWSKNAFDHFIRGLRDSLDKVDSVHSVLDIRNTILSIWLPLCFSAKAHSEVLEGLRECFNNRIDTILSKKANRLDVIGKDIIHSLQTTTKQAARLWDQDFVLMPLGKGSSSFLYQLRARYLSISDSLDGNLTALGIWTQTLKSTRTQIEALQQVRWQDQIEEPDEEAESIATDINKMISQTDPHLYTTSLQTTLKSALSSFEDTICKAARRLSSSDPKLLSASADDTPSDQFNGSSSLPILHLLRAVRETTQLLKSTFPELILPQIQAIIPSLQVHLADEVVRLLSAAMESNTPSSKMSPRATIAPSGLPSPTAFLTLRTICTVMESVGGADTWSPAAVIATKKAVRKHIFTNGSGKGGGDDGRDNGGEAVDGNEGGDHDDAQKMMTKKKVYLRTRFDEIYLREALGGEEDGNKGGDGADGGKDEEEQEVEGEEEQRKAKEYWGRTKLLFGVLA